MTPASRRRRNCSRLMMPWEAHSRWSGLFHGFVDIQGLFKILPGKSPSGSDHGEPVGTGILVGFGGFITSSLDRNPYSSQPVWWQAAWAQYLQFSPQRPLRGVDDGAEIHMVAAEVLLEPSGFLLEFGQVLGQKVLDFRVFRFQPVPSMIRSVSSRSASIFNDLIPSGIICLSL